MSISEFKEIISTAVWYYESSIQNYHYLQKKKKKTVTVTKLANDAINTGKHPFEFGTKALISPTRNERIFNKL